MPNDLYNYSVSLICRAKGRWVIDPEDVSAKIFYKELLGKKPGDCYLASKSRGELSHCIFLSGGVCHADVCGWLITMNGWQILELEKFLKLAQEVWTLFDQAPLKKGHDVRQLLCDLMETKRLVSQASPIRLNQNVKENSCTHSFTSTTKPPVIDSEEKRWWHDFIDSDEKKWKWWYPFYIFAQILAQIFVGFYLVLFYGVLLFVGIMSVRSYWYRYAADRGDASAQYNLANCYARGGLWVSQDSTEAIRWYRLSADQGNTDAQFALGLCYSRGAGVVQDYAEAVRWYRLAATQGDADAQFTLGLCYANGEGVVRDYAEAIHWYRRAAEQGNASAQNNLGVCYECGDGVQKDYTEAILWYRLAAAQGNAIAQFNLGYLIYRGLGVDANREKALYWLKKASAQGHEKAKEFLREIEHC